MKEKRCNSFTGWLCLVLGIALCISLAPGPVMGEEGVDPDADKILRSMSSYLGGATAFKEP
jgi:hypothetical protein